MERRGRIDRRGDSFRLLTHRPTSPQSQRYERRDTRRDEQQFLAGIGVVKLMAVVALTLLIFTQG